MIQISKAPVATAGMLIRKPVNEVFEAFVSADTITNFWFDRSSGRLEKGASVEWHWDLFDMTVDVQVTKLETDKTIAISWGTKNEKATQVEWTFTPRTKDRTYVNVSVSGFDGDGDSIVNAAMDSAGGFALVLAAAKVWLEHGIRLNIVADRF